MGAIHWYGDRKGFCRIPADPGLRPTSFPVVHGLEDTSGVPSKGGEVGSWFPLLPSGAVFLFFG